MVTSRARREGTGRRQESSSAGVSERRRVGRPIELDAASVALTTAGPQPIEDVVPAAASAVAFSSVVDSTTNMLLEISNMTDKEIRKAYRDVRVEEQVKQYCKKQLFHLLKFVTHGSDLASLKHPYSIGNVVMDALNVTDETVRARWWLLYQGVVKKTVDTQRSNCNMAIKSVMVGKLHGCRSFVLFSR